MSMISMLAHHIRTHGPIPTCRVSCAQARGAAKKYAYWGAVRYEIRLTKDGAPTNRPLERASSDRRSLRLAEQDCDAICEREGRVVVDRIGRLKEAEAEDVLLHVRFEYAAAVLKHRTRAAAPKSPRELTFSERLLARQLAKRQAANLIGLIPKTYSEYRHCHFGSVQQAILAAGGSLDMTQEDYAAIRDLAIANAEADALRRAEIHVRTNRLWRKDRWIVLDDPAVDGHRHYYLPYGDDRDAEAFAREPITELRRRIYEACGDRVLSERLRLIQQDDYGQLYDTGIGMRVVRIVCPSTGNVSWLLIQGNHRTVRDAVLKTLGLRDELTHAPWETFK